MKKKIVLSVVENEEGKKFFNTSFGSENHGRVSFRLWISPKLVKRDEKGNYYIEFPVEGAVLRKGKTKKSWILAPSSDHWVVYFYIPCGYRGGSSFEVIYPKEGVEVAKFYDFASPLGSLGISEGGLISIPSKNNFVKIKWSRSGRLYGKDPKGCTIIYKDGKEKKLPIEICECENDLSALECKLGMED
jgi:hypothetical protein